MKHLKRIVVLVLAVALMLSVMPGYTSASAAGDTPNFIKVDGKRVSFPDEQPYIEDGTTLVPIRFISEALGYKVDWEQSTETVIMTSGETVIRLPIGSTTVTVNGAPQEVSKAAIVRNDRTFVPLRYISEVTGCTVDWWAINNAITINARTADGEEVKLFERCKQSELFVQDEDAWYVLRPVSGLAYSISEQSYYEVDPDFPTQSRGVQGYEIQISITDNIYAVRQEVKELLKTFYPTGYNEVYELMKQSMFGNTGEEFYLSGDLGTSGKYSYDGRPVVMRFKSHSNMTGAVLILKPGAEPFKFDTTHAVDPADHYIFGDGLWGFSSDYERDYTVSRHELDKW